jgi:hypothetical protein
MYLSLSVYLSVCVSICVWLYSLCEPWPLFQFLNLCTVGRTPWMGDQLAARPLHTQNSTNRINTHRLRCLKWDSNPRSQCLSGRRRFMPWIARLLGSLILEISWLAGLCYIDIRVWCELCRHSYNLWNLRLVSIMFLPIIFIKWIMDI